MADSPTRTMRATRSRYSPTAELGRGATATVWRARDARTGREVALKRFHPHLAADPVARARIEEEVAAASRVSHPNIISAVDQIDDRDGLALVFPFVAGATLAQRLGDGQRLAPRAAAQIALDISDALGVAHASGVIHRDVKPANILLGEDGKARLLDFGNARAIDEVDEQHALTGAGMAIGTLPYMAPEQLAAGPITPASDVYALGVVMYEMLAGRQPYAAASPVTLANEQAQPPAAVADVPAPLMALTLEMLAADAAQRPDAAQVARGLRAWLDGRADAEAATSLVVAARPPLIPGPGRPLGWPAAGLAAIAIAIAVPVVAAGFLTPGPAQPNLAPTTTAGDVSVAAAPVTPTSTATPTPAPTPAPVINASRPVPPPADSEGGGRHRHHHHKHHRHGPHED